MDRQELKEIYSQLWNARETVAGSNILDLPDALERVGRVLDAMAILVKQFNEEATPCSYETFLIWMNKTTMAKDLLKEARDYGGRLEPDRILCDVLNEMLKKLE